MGCYWPEPGRGGEVWLPLFIPIGQLSGFYTVQLANHSGSWKDNKRWCPSEGNKKKKRRERRGTKKIEYGWWIGEEEKRGRGWRGGEKRREKRGRGLFHPLNWSEVQF